MSPPNPGANNLVEFWSEFDDDAIVIAREDVGDFNAENILPQDNNTLQHILTWLNPTNYDDDGSEYQKHISSHLPGTGDWVFESEVYQQWHDSNEHGILWVRGIPGAGKSVLASTMIQKLHQETVPVLFFFFRHTIDANHSPNTLLRDWLAQVLRYSPPLQLELKEFAQKHSYVDAMSLSDLWRLIHRALMYLPKVYCIIDAMDEMDRDRLESFLKSLDALGRWRPAEIKLIVTGRPISVMERTLRGIKILDVRLDKKSVKSDIIRYIDYRLESLSTAPQQYPRLKEEILQRADGLFLYAKLTLDSLQSSTNFQKTFDAMPADLTGIYSDLLREHSYKSGIPPDLQSLILQMVTHATRPLRLLELADIVKVNRGESDLGKIKDQIRSACGPLLEILPDETVRVIHHSLTEYLKGEDPNCNADERLFPIFEFGATHHHLAILCLSYLRSGCLGHVQIENRRETQGDVHYTQAASLLPHQVLPPFLEYAIANWRIHAQRAIHFGADQTKLLEELDHLLSHTDLDKLDVLMNTRMPYQPSPWHFAIALDLRDYAKHLAQRNEAASAEKNGIDPTLILYAAEKGNDFMVKLLLDLGVDPNHCDKRGEPPLHLAVAKGFSKVAAILLQVGVDPEMDNAPDDSFRPRYVMSWERGPKRPWTPAQHAFTNGSMDMAALFYEYLHTPDQVATALWCAASSHESRIVELILRHPMANVNAIVGGSTALYRACESRDIKIMALLLDAGADPNILCKGHRTLQKEEQEQDFAAGLLPLFEGEVADENGQSPMLDASSIGENALHAWANKESPRHYRRRNLKPTVDEMAKGVKLLFEHGANLHQIDATGATPLHVASDAVTIRCFLEAGADKNAVNSKGQSLLHISTDDQVLDILLPGADVNLKMTGTGRTPLLHTLIDFSHHQDGITYSKILRLLDCGADVKAVDHLGNSALHLAVGFDNTDKHRLLLIERLCALGADVNLQNYNGKTPLHMNGPGSGRGHILGRDPGEFRSEVFQALIAAGADLEIKDNQGCTPLFQLIEHTDYIWHVETIKQVEEMIRMGSSIDILDSRGRSLLHAAVRIPFREPALWDLLVAKGLDPNHTDYDGNTMFHDAASVEDITAYRVDKLKRLMDKGIDPRQPNHQGWTPFHVISSIRPKALDTSRHIPSPVHTEYATAFDYFLSLQSDVDCADKGGITPLHLACTFSEHITRRLLENGADLCRRTKEGLTSFHIAARSRQPNIIGILLDELQNTTSPESISSIVNAKDKLDRTALYYAAASGVVETCQLLLNVGAFVDDGSYSGSAWDGCASFENELARADWSRKSKYHPYGRPYEREADVAAGAVIISDATRPLREDTRSLPFATERLDEILDLLSSSDSLNKINFVDEAVMFAVKSRYDYTVERLLRVRESLARDSGHSVDEKSLAEPRRLRDGCSKIAETDPYQAIVELMKLRDYEQVSCQLASTELFNKKESRNWRIHSLLDQLAQGGFKTLLSRILHKLSASRPDDQTESDMMNENSADISECLSSILMAAARREHPNLDVIRVLVEDHQLDVRAHRHWGENVLHSLASSGHWWQTTQAIPYFIQHGADLEVKNPSGRTALGIALGHIGGPNFSKRTVSTLLDLGADPNGVDDRGQSYLSWTVKHKDIFELLISHGAVITQPTLIAAIRDKDVDLIQMMLANGADANMRTAGKEIPEEMDSDGPISHGRRDPQSHDEQYPLDWMACETHWDLDNLEVNKKIFKMLLDHGADPMGRYAQTTVFHRIMTYRKYRSSEDNLYARNVYLPILLEQPGLDIEARDRRGMTPLLVTCEHYSDEAVESWFRTIQTLRHNGADILARDNKGRSALHLVIRKKSHTALIVEIAPELVNSPDIDGKLPLHYSLSSHVHGTSEHGLFELLIDAGSDIRQADNEGNTPLHLMMKGSKWLIHLDDTIGRYSHHLFEQLVSKGADLNARNSAGESPVFAYFRTARIEAEIDTSDLRPVAEEDSELEDSQQKGQRYQRALEIARRKARAAVDREHFVWELFDKHGQDWSATNSAGETLLHLVAKDSSISWDGYTVPRRATRFKALMDRGLDPMAEDKEHRTPLDLAATLKAADILELFKVDE